jgi:hypothetical protein
MKFHLHSEEKVTFAGYMVDISDPQEWDFTGTANIPADNLHLPRANAFYLGGNTPHVWTEAQIVRQSNDYRLPIWVYDPLRITVEDAQKDAEAAVKALTTLGYPTGKVVILDMETYVNGPYSEAFASALTAAGFKYAPYESEGIAGNHVDPDIGRWYAEWDNDPSTVEAGAFGKQYANPKLTDRAYDLSVLTSFEYLWDIKASQKEPDPVTISPEPEPSLPPPPLPSATVIGATINLVYSNGVTQTLTANGIHSGSLSVA